MRTFIAWPAFTTEIRDGDFEVRRYGARTVAKTEVEGDWSSAGNEGFRRLAGYIFGKNRRRAELPMTAPVGQASQAATERVERERDLA